MMSKQKPSNAPKPRIPEYHNAAVCAILQLIDEALSEGKRLTKPELNTALDTLAQEGNLKKMERGQLVSYPGKRLKELAERLVKQVEPTKCRSSLDGLLRYGSSYIKKDYLLKMGWVNDDHDELSADYHETEKQETEKHGTANELANPAKSRSRDFCT